MKARIGNRRTNASIFMEYAMIIGVVSLVMVTMNIYIKRGMQGRIKEMTDYFISNEQLVEIDPITTDTDTTTDTITTETTNIGGGTMLALLDRSETDSTSTVTDETTAYSDPIVPAEEGFVEVPERREDGDYIDDSEGIDWEKETDIKVLEMERDRLRAKVEQLERKANTIEAEGGRILGQISGLISRRSSGISRRLRRITGSISEARAILALGGSGHGCNKDACAEAAVKLYRTGNDLIKQASDMRNEARALRDEADRIQDKIDDLEET